MPMGAIAALLLREGVVNGFRVAAAGATGVAVIDTAYCLLATFAGALLAPVVQQSRGLFLAASGGLVVLVGLHQLSVALRARTQTAAPRVVNASSRSTFLRFLALTSVNPLTLVYFVALAGAVTSHAQSWVGPVVFVVAVGSSSWAWQLLVAALGSVLGRTLSMRVIHVVGVVASLIVVALGGAVIASGVSG